jgi:hypothetical protein
MVYVASESTGLWATFKTEPGSVDGGTTYNFWIRARNYVGLGLASEKIAIVAAQIPD